MPKSSDSRAKRLASLLDPNDKDSQLEDVEKLVDMIQGDSWCIGCNAVTPESRPWLSTRTIAWGALLVGLFVPPLFPLDEIIGTASAFRGPAVGVHELTLLNPSVHSGEPLIVNIKSEYLKVCNWRWVHEWVRRDNGMPIAIDWLPGTAHVLGVVSEHNVALDLPRGIQPGNYVLRTSGTGDCGRGDMAQVRENDLSFAVTN